MLYVAMTFWLLVIVFLAWGVHQLWSGMIKPRTVNSILLPGTLVAQLGHVLGLLVTGATVSNTTLYKDDDSGEPETTRDAKPRIPVVGPVIIGLLPLLACATAIFFVARYLGDPMVDQMTQKSVATALPSTVAGMWDTLRDQVTLAEHALNAALEADTTSWQAWLFMYLLICLTVRMAPFPGTMRGSLGAILLLGLGAWILGMIASSIRDTIIGGWRIMSLSVAALSFLLLASLTIRGGVGLIKLLAANR
ncbi:MAG: hypothetical protein JSV19_05795 [Phycisphaerales bacterium]|nr:MAG: hypothetical protein JSV19_05795 [Phycisphaerales bacterium]